MRAFVLTSIRTFIRTFPVVCLAAAMPIAADESTAEAVPETPFVAAADRVAAVDREAAGGPGRGAGRAPVADATAADFPNIEDYAPPPPPVLVDLSVIAPSFRGRDLENCAQRAAGDRCR